MSAPSLCGLQLFLEILKGTDRGYGEKRWSEELSGLLDGCHTFSTHGALLANNCARNNQLNAASRDSMLLNTICPRRERDLGNFSVIMVFLLVNKAEYPWVMSWHGLAITSLQEFRGSTFEPNFIFSHQTKLSSIMARIGLTCHDVS